MSILAILSIAGPILAGVLPLLKSPAASLWNRVFKHSATTVTGVVGTGVLGGLLASFPCLADTSAWQKVAIAAIPLIFGALNTQKEPIKIDIPPAFPKANTSN